MEQGSNYTIIVWIGSKNVVEVKRVLNRVMSVKMEIEVVIIMLSGVMPLKLAVRWEEKEISEQRRSSGYKFSQGGESVIVADFSRHVCEGSRGNQKVRRGCTGLLSSKGTCRKRW